MTLKIAVVGAGPSAMYLTTRLLKKTSDANVYIFDRNYAPFGLIRTGVSPDTIAIKVIH
jgi:ferredoxin--NADP+ reductase